jgi:hypothetical protein
VKTFYGSFVKTFYGSFVKTFYGSFCLEAWVSETNFPEHAKEAKGFVKILGFGRRNFGN